MISIKCRACGKALEIPDQYAGKTGKCNGCGGAIQVPKRITRKHVVVAIFALVSVAVAWSIVAGAPRSHPVSDNQLSSSEAISTHAEGRFLIDGDGVTCNVFEIVAELRGNELSFHLDTDLPDSAEVIATVSRSYFEKGDPQTAYSRDYFTQEGKVAYWKSEKTCSVEDRIFSQSLQEQIDKMASLSMPFEVAQISDDIEVSFVLPQVQDPALFGDKNSKLQGAMVPTSGIKSVRAAFQISRPFGQTASEIPKATTASHDMLELGKSYVLSKETPLMPEFEPADPLSAIAHKSSIPISSTIVIRERREKSGVRWYRVLAFESNGTQIAEGWVNSIALIGQTIMKAD